MPHMRFRDTRHSAATNMHQLTGDFYTVGQILGHSLKGIDIQLNLSTNLEAVTAQYVDVRPERKHHIGVILSAGQHEERNLLCDSIKKQVSMAVMKG